MLPYPDCLVYGAVSEARGRHGHAAAVRAAFELNLKGRLQFLAGRIMVAVKEWRLTGVQGPTSHISSMLGYNQAIAPIHTGGS